MIGLMRKQNSPESPAAGACEIDFGWLGSGYGGFMPVSCRFHAKRGGGREGRREGGKAGWRVGEGGGRKLGAEQMPVCGSKDALLCARF